MSRSALGESWACPAERSGVLQSNLGLLFSLFFATTGFLSVSRPSAIAYNLTPKDFPASCGVCHGNAGNPAPDGTVYPDRSGAHTVHVVQMDYDCVLCHNTPGGPGADGHFDFVIPADVILSATSPLIGPNASYDPATQTCRNVYCHNPSGTSQVSGPPAWFDPATVSCGTCHPAALHSPEDLNNDGFISSEDLQLFTLAWQGNSGPANGNNLLAFLEVWHTSPIQPQLPGSHAVHFDRVRGPGITACTTCHPDNTVNHSPIDGEVRFADGGTLATTNVCNHCHGSTAETKPVWGQPVSCRSCHKADNPANSKADGTGLSALDKSASFFTSGHGRPSDQNHAVTGNPGAGFSACLPCHEPYPTQGQHISQVIGDEKRLKLVPPDSRAYTNPTTEICLDCHLPGQISAGFLGEDATAEAMVHSTAVTGHFGSSTEAPTAFPAYGNQADLAGSPGFQCLVCHDPHGTTNLAMIRPQVDGILGGVSNPSMVVMTEQDPRWARGGQDGQGLCEACHLPAGPAHPDTAHPGNHNLQSDCRGCHRNHGNSFRPSAQATSCLGCHNSPQGDRRAVGQDFQLASHHAIGSITDTQCVVCHDQSEHMGGVVRLRDYNHPGVTVDYTTSESLEPFCLGCHDADGAGGNHAPFDEGGLVANIDATWATSAHKAGGRTCMGEGVTGCHDNGHGSMKRKLLAPADEAPVEPARAEEEEGFCFRCHDASGPAPSDIQAEFALASHHDVSHADQTGHGSKLECTNCHNPHASNSAHPLIDPDNPQEVWAGSEADFCLRCHDGTPPPGVLFPSTTNGTGYDKSQFPTSRHGQTGQVSCGNCHTRHGSSEASLKSARYDQNDRVTYLHGSDQYALCWQCHDENKVVRTTSASIRNAFGTLHNKHVRDERGPCIECHDPHTPWDTGEDGHISYQYPVTNGWSFNLTVGGTSHTLSTSFLDTGTNKGKCYLSCHGQSHNSKSYTGVEANTLLSGR